MSENFYIECLDCSHRTSYDPSQITCPACGSEWREARYDYAALSNTLLPRLQNRQFNLWRYGEVLPIATPVPDLTLGLGGTPLIRAANLGLMLGYPHIYIKDERQGPTHSFKDRQAALTIAALKEAGITEIVIASTGNVAIAYSALAARAGIKCWAFLTSKVPAEKMREVALYGTQVIKVTASYDQAKQVAAEFARQRGFYLDRGTRSISSVEGMKTIAYESTEQLSLYYRDNLPPEKDPQIPWRAPDWYIQAVSGGLGPVGVQKGFAEMKEIGLIDRIPAFGIIQAEGCSPMVQAWRKNMSRAEPIPSPKTHISTLATGDPGRSYTLLQERMRNSGGGFFESVTDEEAFRAVHIVAKMEGMSVEPAAAVAFAGLIKLVRAGVIRQDEVVVVNCTGHTMPIEAEILGEKWSQDVVVPSHSTFETAEEGLLAALSRVTEDKYPRILIVDDTPDARRLIMRILQSQGNYTLFQAEDGLGAIRTAREERPDLIILDLMMPELDGFAVLDQLKEEPSTEAIPVIVVTAKELTMHEKARLSGRIESLMQKGSFMDDELLKEIKALVKG
jgi:threonine synthase